ncbi:hypothetical protein RclHR1_04740003 [Rhizophagus clarus]|uniref:F-box domain-containing protein n=1 Tax=Rhizophagus clarus TaxID=94130 RepID=A0A2Z6S0N8_9GLOM|nr:hypothetical protein RclHR1_04740003 [Rhizophagus clarus]GES79290.1 hypothetical protein GLOIN_2v1882635 [Rhizophagus clarus]
MACSKICSGNLPELTDEIIQYFRNDFSTLHSCILVNRLWCRLAIPLLWEDPFSIPNQNYQFIKILLYNLNENDKTQLNENYRINNNNVFFSNALFNYSSFIKRLNTQTLRFSVENWVTNLANNFENFANLIYKLLVKTFIENEVNLYSFEVVLLTSRDQKYFNDILELILENSKFVYNIRNLVLHLSLLPGVINIIPFLNFLISNCSSISSVYFKISRNFTLSIEKYLSEIIISQHNLKKVSFEYNTSNLYNSLLLTLQNSNCSNTLNTIVFYCINFKNVITYLKEVFNNLNVLESIHIFYCLSLNSNFVQQIINTTKPFKLRSLFMDEILQIYSLQLLLQRFGNYLENFGFEFGDSEQKQQLLEILVKYCTNIRYFDLAGPHNININLAFSLIENNVQNLNYLFIEFDLDFDDCHLSDDIIDLSSTILRNLGQILPSKLEYLCLELNLNAGDLEIFLKNCQNTFIRKLLIKTIVLNEFEDILSYIKEYIMKEKRVEYLAYSEYGFSSIMDDLFSLKDEVNEFKLYNIKVRRYCDLYIRTYDFVNNYYSNSKKDM